MTKKPFLTVAMPVFNGQKYLKEAIESVLAQTYDNFELLIIDDGSTDQSVEIIKSIKDPRIRLVQNERNYGVGYTRNVGIDEAEGEYMAWMDCDDLIHPQRLEKQLNYLLQHPEIGICGTWMVRIGEGREKILKSSTNPEIIKASLFFYPSIYPATAMYNMALVKKAGIRYDRRLLVAEDYDFYFEASFHFPLQNLGEILYSYRASETSIMKKYEDQEAKMLEFHTIINKKAFDKLQLEKNEENLIKHRRIKSKHVFDNWKDYMDSFNWLLLLKEQNKKLKLYNLEAFDEVLGNMFYFVSKKSSQLGLRVFFFYMKNLIKFNQQNSGSIFKLFARCLIKYNKF